MKSEYELYKLKKYCTCVAYGVKMYYKKYNYVFVKIAPKARKKKEPKKFQVPVR